MAPSGWLFMRTRTAPPARGTAGASLASLASLVLAAGVGSTAVTFAGALGAPSGSTDLVAGASAATLPVGFSATAVFSAGTGGSALPAAFSASATLVPLGVGSALV